MLLSSLLNNVSADGSSQLLTSLDVPAGNLLVVWGWAFDASGSGSSPFTVHLDADTAGTILHEDNLTAFPGFGGQNTRAVALSLLNPDTLRLRAQKTSGTASVTWTAKFNFIACLTAGDDPVLTAILNAVTKTYPFT